MQTFCSCSLGKSIQSGIFTKEGLIAIVGIIINRHTCLLLKGVIEIYRSYFDQNLAQSCYHVT